MATHSAQRRLVKSRPELWAEISDQQSLARRLEAFGEIRITGTDPETTVAWEGTAASGTVKIESAGWGTKVILTVELADPPAVAEPEPEPVAQEVAAEPKPEPVAMQAPTPKPEPVATQAPTPEPAAAAPKKGLFARLFGFGPPIPDPPRAETTTKSVAAPAPAPAPEPESAPTPPPAPLTPPEVEPTVIAEPAAATMPDGHSVDDFLSAVLDDLGAAHHRPFSRS